MYRVIHSGALAQLFRGYRLPRAESYSMATDPVPQLSPLSVRLVLNLASKKFHFSPLWFCLCRTWRTNLPKGACALLLTSVDHDRAPVVGVRVNVLLSRYLIEPCGSGKSKLTYLCRADVRYVLSLLFGMVKVMKKIETFLSNAKNGLNECIVVSWYSMKNGVY